MPDVTRILRQIEHGDPAAADQLLPLVYDELRKLAAQRLAQERPGQTLAATALVHEAYLRLVSAPSTAKEASGERCAEPQECAQHPNTEVAGSGRSWNSRGHFFAAAAEAMRRIVIENARRNRQARRGGGWTRVPMEEAELCVATDGVATNQDDLLALDESLDRLETHDPLAARLVKLRYFVGMSIPEAAEALGVSVRTAERNWTYARAWLARDLG